LLDALGLELAHGLFHLGQVGPEQDDGDPFLDILGFARTGLQQIFPVLHHGVGEKIEFRRRMQQAPHKFGPIRGHLPLGETRQRFVQDF
jgi:hypothetical protein